MLWKVRFTWFSWNRNWFWLLSSEMAILTGINLQHISVQAWSVSLGHVNSCSTALWSKLVFLCYRSLLAHCTFVDKLWWCLLNISWHCSALEMLCLRSGITYGVKCVQRIDASVSDFINVSKWLFFAESLSWCVKWWSLN